MTTNYNKQQHMDDSKLLSDAMSDSRKRIVKTLEALEVNYEHYITNVVDHNNIQNCVNGLRLAYTWLGRAKYGINGTKIFTFAPDINSGGVVVEEDAGYRAMLCKKILDIDMMCKEMADLFTYVTEYENLALHIEPDPLDCMACAYRHLTEAKDHIGFEIEDLRKKYQTGRA